MEKPGWFAASGWARAVSFGYRVRLALNSPTRFSGRSRERGTNLFARQN